MRIQSKDGQDYHLPNVLNEFQLRMYVHLINWKWKHITREVGYNEHKGEKIPYDAILPDEYVCQEKMPHIYSSILKNLADHRGRNSFRIHPHFYHMASSQAANINLFLPILHHSKASAILGGIKKDFASLATDHLDNGYCLEFWGGNFGHDNTDKGPIGDKSAKAGTDSDIAIAYRNHQGEFCLWLIEHKLLEDEFTTCGGYKSSQREKRHDCTRSFAEIILNRNTCYYHDVRNFKYWDITAKNNDFFVNHAKHPQCPFQGGMNQLWRNQLLALALEQDKRQTYKHTSFSVVKHPDNKYLDRSLDDYRSLVNKNPKFSVFTSADVLRAAEKYGNAHLGHWIDWYKKLYNL